MRALLTRLKSPPPAPPPPPPLFERPPRRLKFHNFLRHSPQLKQRMEGLWLHVSQSSIVVSFFRNLINIA